VRSFSTVKVGRSDADTTSVNTIAASTSRIPRAGMIALVALVAAFALLMVVRLGVIGGSSSTDSVQPVPSPVVTPARPAPVKPAVVLLPGLPSDVAHALRYSKVVVVSLYLGQARADHAVVGETRRGARAAGAGFVAVNVGSDKKAATIASFAGPASAPTMLVVRRPGKIITRISGPVESAIVTQAAHNAGARR
jgi:hypothetical protein